MGIQELPLKTVNLIKSSQVIISLTSIVKELIENSLDAHASIISIKLEQFGFQKLEVKDNGDGVKEEDVKYVAKPHYTSKISTHEDLETLSQYGFRGEALSSLCAVSTMTLSTKDSSCPIAYLYAFDIYGNITSKKPTAALTGTTISVSNLFKNLPVRKQFYSNAKRRKEEFKKVEDLIMAYSIIVPELQISLYHDKQLVYQKTSSDEISKSLFAVFRDASKKLTHRSFSNDLFNVRVWLPNKGCIRDSSCRRTSNDRLFLFVNQRPVTHKTIEKLIKSYFSQPSEGAHGRYPVGTLIIEVSSGSVDVNLEPNKTKVLFQNEELLLNSIEELLADIYGKLPSGNCSQTANDNVVPCTYVTVESQCGKENILQLDTKSEDSSDEKHTTTVKLVGKTSPIKLNENNCNGLLQNSTNYNQLAPQMLMKKTIFNSTLLSLDDEFKTTKEIDFDFGSLSTVKSPSFPQHLNEYSEIEDFISMPLRSKDINNLTFQVDTEMTKSHDHHYDVCKTSEFLPLNSKADGPLQLGHKEEDVEINIQYPGNMILNEDALSMETEVLPALSTCNDLVTMKTKDLVTKRKDLVLTGSTNMSFSSMESNSNDKIVLESSFPSRCGSIDREQNAKSNQFSSEKIVLYQDTNLNDTKFTISDWSRGCIMQRGNNIQTVRIASEVQEGKRKRMSLDSETNNQSSKKNRSSDLSNSSLELSNITKQIETAFSLFAKDTRKQIIQESPGIDFTLVAQAIASRWKTASEDLKQMYEVKAKESNAASSMFKKLDKGKESYFKQTKLINSTTGQMLQKALASKFPESEVRNNKQNSKMRPWQNKKLSLSSSIADIKEKLEERNKMSESEKSSMNLIGCLKGANGWLFRVGDEICALNSSKLNEVILFHTLMQSFPVPASPLRIPIEFNSSSLGLSEWEFLLTLSRSRSYNKREELNVTDPRINANGIQIQLIADENNVTQSGRIIGMLDALDNYGLNDFVGILRKIQENSTVALEVTRPEALRLWLKGEALRIAKETPEFRNSKSLDEKLRSWQKLSSGADVTKTECLHGHKIFSTLINFVTKEKNVSK